VFCGVLRCFAVFYGCFAGVLRCFASVFKKTVFCGVLPMFLFCNVLDVFCECFCRHFLSERKMHSTVLRCIAQSTKRILFVLCVLYILFGLFCAVL